jgi:hypothetical protein
MMAAYILWTGFVNNDDGNRINNKKQMLHLLLQRIVTVSYNSLTFHYYATCTFLLYAITCFLMFTDRADARLLSNNACAILLSTS